MRRRPIKYRLNNGRLFDLEIIKDNVRSFWIRLKGRGANESKLIRVQKRSSKLIWQTRKKETKK